jgi:hypothetical protein
VKRQPAQPVSDDPADVFEHGVAPRHRLTSPLHALQRGQLAPQSFGGILVRLPRRLSKIVAEDAHRWVRGETPISVEPAPNPTRWGTREEWERAYPGFGLGLPKPLPRRRHRVSPEERAALHQELSDLIDRLGGHAAVELNRSARERLLAARGVIEEAVEQSAPGSHVTGFEVDDYGNIRLQILAPIKEIHLRMIVGPEVEVDG